MAGMMQPPRIVRSNNPHGDLNAGLKELGLDVEVWPTQVSGLWADRVAAVLAHLVALEVERQKAGK